MRYKRNDNDEKVTDMLYACYDAVAEGRSYKKILDKIKERYNEIIDGLDLNLNLDHVNSFGLKNLPCKDKCLCTAYFKMVLSFI